MAQRWLKSVPARVGLLLALGILAACGRAPLASAPTDPAPAASSAPATANAPAPTPAPAPSNTPPRAAPAGKPAPELSGGGAWLHSDPLTLEGLRGKVVLIDFWTYGCINCQRTLPYVQAWWEQYKDQGLVIIGVHTPEFAHERELANVQAAAQRLGVTWPVVQDNEMRIWRAYRNNYWPHFYLIDKQGNIVYDHIGEGAYDETERQIVAALRADA